MSAATASVALVACDAENTRRFMLLCELSGASIAWWHDVLASGAFVAGGASLFVADTTQCVADVGDVDLWAPVDDATIQRWVQALRDQYEAADVAFCVYARRATVTVYTERLKLQFIRIAAGTTPLETISHFDLTYVQVALVSSGVVPAVAPAPSGITLGIVATPLAHEAWRTRMTAAVDGSLLWAHKPSVDEIRAGINARKAIGLQRLQKASRKGFACYSSGSDTGGVCHTAERQRPPAHSCDASHCHVDEWPDHVGSRFDNYSFALIEFDRHSYCHYRDGDDDKGKRNAEE